MHCYIPAHNLKYMAYAIFLESGLVLIMVELALNSSVKRPVYSHEFFRALTFSTRKYIKFSLLPALAENIVILIYLCCIIQVVGYRYDIPQTYHTLLSNNLFNEKLVYFFTSPEI